MSPAWPAQRAELRRHRNRPLQTADDLRADRTDRAGSPGWGHAPDCHGTVCRQLGHPPQRPCEGRPVQLSPDIQINVHPVEASTPSCVGWGWAGSANMPACRSGPLHSASSRPRHCLLFTGAPRLEAYGSQTGLAPRSAPREAKTRGFSESLSPSAGGEGLFRSAISSVMCWASTSKSPVRCYGCCTSPSGATASARVPANAAVRPPACGSLP